MRDYADSSSGTRSKQMYCNDQPLDPIPEYDDELDYSRYEDEEEQYDGNETVDEEECEYYDKNQYVVENRKRYVVKPTKSREAQAQPQTPARIKYIYQKNHASERTSSGKSNSFIMPPNQLSPSSSKPKLGQRWYNKPAINQQQHQPQQQQRTKKNPEGSSLSMINSLREKLFANHPTLEKTHKSSSTSQAPTGSTSKHRRTSSSVVTDKIHHDSGDGPRKSQEYKVNLAELLKITDDTFSNSFQDNEVVANLVSDMNSLQMDNIQHINDMERQKHEVESYFPQMLNLESFPGYQACTASGLGHCFSQSFLDSLQMPKKNSSTQANFDLDGGGSSDGTYQPSSQEKINESNDKEDADNATSEDGDLAELKHLQNTKKMVCDLINKEIEKIAKSKNMDTSVSRRFLLTMQEHEVTSGDDVYRRTRLETLNTLASEIKKLITLEQNFNSND